MIASGEAGDRFDLGISLGDLLHAPNGRFRFDQLERLRHPMRVADDHGLAEFQEPRPGAGDDFGPDAGHVAHGNQQARRCVHRVTALVMDTCSLAPLPGPAHHKQTAQTGQERLLSLVLAREADHKALQLRPFRKLRRALHAEVDLHQCIEKPIQPSLAQMFHYNGRPLPAAVLVDEDGATKLIRRHDQYEDLIVSDVW